ncbi:MAG: nuclear transport factor 2 family protein [Actinomycetota bacterium]|nr:nuclear transport factor 2 family protein [Actinomycetota bacterium]
MRLEPGDYTAIANLLAEYCLALDHDEVDRCVALFTEDGAFEVYGRTWEGHDRLRKMMAAAPGGLHLGGPPFVESVEDDVAHTRQNLLFIERSGRELRRTLYTDELCRTAQGWRIRKRRCQFITAEGVQDRPGD